MKKKYLYNGGIYTEEQMAEAAKASGMPVSEYVSQIGAKAVADEYNYNGKKYSPEQVLEASKASDLSFDDYLSSANISTPTVKKKEETYGGSPFPSFGEKAAGSISAIAAKSLMSNKKTDEDLFDLKAVKALQDRIDLERSYPSVIMPGNGKEIKINPDRLPDGFAKTTEGAKQYAELLQSRLDLTFNGESPETISEFKKAYDEFQMMEAGYFADNSRSILNKADIDGINKYIPFDGTVTDNVLSALRAEKQKIKQEVSGGMYPDGVTAKSNINRGKRLYELQYYIDKLSRVVQKEIEHEKTQVVVGADTRSVLQKALTIMPDIKVDNEKLGNEFFTGLDKVKRSDKVRYDNIVKRLNEGKALASIEVAELINDGAEIIQARNVERLLNKEITLDKYTEVNDRVSQVVTDNFYKRPDILQRHIANIIGRYYEKSGGVIIGKWYVSDEEIDTIPKEVFAAAGIDISRPESKAALQKIKDNEGVLPFDNAVQKDDLFREAFKGFVQPIKGIGQTIEGLATSDEEKLVDRKLEPLTNYANQRGEYFNRKYGYLADAVNGAGQFISQYFLMEAGIVAFKGFGLAAGGSEASLLVRSPESIGIGAIRHGVGGTAIRQGTKAGNFLIDKSKLYGQLAVPFLQSYDSNYKTALERTNSPIAAKVMATTNSLAESLSEKMFDNVNFGRSVIKDFTGRLNPMRIAKIFDNGVINAATQRELKKTIGDVLKLSIKTAGKSFGNTVQEAAEEIVPAFSDYVTTAIVNPDAVIDRDVFSEIKDAFVAGLVSFSIPGIIGGVGKIRSQFGSSETDNFALAAAAMNRNLVSDALHNLHQDGAISQDELNHKMQILNTATSALRNMPARYTDGERIKPVDANDYLANIVRIKFLKKEAEESDDEAVKQANLEKINALNGLNFDIINRVADEEHRLMIKRDAAKTLGLFLARILK